MEDTRTHNACPSCGSALQAADVEWLHVRETDAETVFELEVEPIERAAIVDALIANGIRHRWDDTHDLVVEDSNVDAVDLILDEILGEDDESDEGDDDDFDDEDDDEDFDGSGADEGYDVLSDLFVATDKLLKNRNLDRIETFRDAADHVLQTLNPFGIDSETWADVQSAARNASVALDADPRAPIDADLKGLYNQLQLLV